MAVRLDFSGSDGVSSTGIRPSGRRRLSTDAITVASEFADADDTEGLSWLNDILSKLWPTVAASRDLFGKIQAEMEETVQRKLPAVLKEKFHLKSVDMGTATPNFGPIQVDEFDGDEDGSIKIKVGVDYQSNTKVTYTFAGIDGGVSAIKVVGTVRVVLGPLLPDPPFVGGVDVFFVNTPDIDLTFHGVAKVAGCPGFQDIVRKAVKIAVRKTCVLPNRIRKQVASSKMDAKASTWTYLEDPIGILRLKVLRARHLPAKDFSLFGKSTSDPYVDVRLGKTKLRTPVVPKTTSPDWADGAQADFLIYSLEQWFSFKVFDKDFTKDDPLGNFDRATGAWLLEQAAEHDGEVTLPLSENGWANGGELVVQVAFASVSSPAVQDTSAESDFNFWLLAVSIRLVEGLEGRLAKPPFRVRASINGISATSEVSVTPKANKVEKHRIAKPLEDVIVRLHDVKGKGDEEIADLLDLRLDDVKSFLLQRADPERWTASQKAAHKQRMASQACFRESVYLILPFATASELCIELLNCDDAVVGNMKLFSQSLVEARNLNLDGAYGLDIGGQKICPVVGTLRLRALIGQLLMLPASTGYLESLDSFLRQPAHLRDDALKAAVEHWHLGSGPALKEVQQLHANPGDDIPLRESNKNYEQLALELDQIAETAVLASHRDSVLPAAPDLAKLKVRIADELAKGEAVYNERYPSGGKGFMRRMSNAHDSRRRAMRFLLVKRWRVLEKRANDAAQKFERRANNAAQQR